MLAREKIDKLLELFSLYDEDESNDCLSTQDKYESDVNDRPLTRSSTKKLKKQKLLQSGNVNKQPYISDKPIANPRDEFGLDAKSSKEFQFKENKKSDNNDSELSEKIDFKVNFFDVKLVNVDLGPIIIEDTDKESELSWPSVDDRNNPDYVTPEKDVKHNVSKEFKRKRRKESATLQKTRKLRKIDSNSLKCEKCNVKIKNEQLYMFHKQIHEGRQETECLVCGKNFDDVGSLLSHFASFDKNQEDEHFIRQRPYLCEICGSRFKGKKYLAEHLSFHATEKPKFLCQICGKQFGHHAHLRIHLKLHKRSEYFCEKCNKIFNFRSSRQWKTHLRLIHGENNYKCLICNKAFPLRSLLKKHMTSKHCHLCKIHFINFKDYHVHMKEVHNIEKQYPCTICDKQFSVKYLLKNHLATKHCLVCKLTFISEKEQTVHMKEIHNQQKKYPCSICGRVFPLNCMLTKHLRSKHCLICRIGFDTLKDFNHHMKIVHNNGRKFRCQKCDKSFSVNTRLEKHIQEVHTINKRICETCDKVFTHLRNYNAHMTRIHGVANPIKLERAIKKAAEEKSASNNVSKTPRVFPEIIEKKNCIICGKKCKNDRSYIAHMRVKHKIQIDSKRKISHKKALIKKEQNKKKQNQKYCDLCSKEFKDYRSYKTHENKFHKSENYIKHKIMNAYKRKLLKEKLAEEKKNSQKVSHKTSVNQIDIKQQRNEYNAVTDIKPITIKSKKLINFCNYNIVNANLKNESVSKIELDKEKECQNIIS